MTNFDKMEFVKWNEKREDGKFQMLFPFVCQKLNGTSSSLEENILFQAPE